MHTSLSTGLFTEEGESAEEKRRRLAQEAEEKRRKEEAEKQRIADCESLMGEKKYGIDEKRLGEYAQQIKEIHDMGVQMLELRV